MTYAMLRRFVAARTAIVLTALWYALLLSLVLLLAGGPAGEFVYVRL